MKNMPVALAASLMLVCAILGVLVGYYLTPAYRLAMYDDAMELGTPDRFFDLRYVNAMIAHHRAAMLMAAQAQSSKRDEVKTLADAILQDEPKLIDELYRYKADWYRDTRRVPDPQVPQFGAYDETFDLRFLNALIAHHEEGIRMTRETRTKSSRAEVQNNANAVEAFLTKTGETLRGWRADWYNL